MSPEAAVACLAEILAARAELTEDELYAAMASAGVPEPVADRAYKFTQIAWGRVLLDGLGVKFAPDYLCFDGAGEIIESGLLAEQPYFVAAMAAARQRPPPAGLPRFAQMSADVSAVNSALNAGSRPEDLVTGPPALFMELPTQAGIDKARQLLAKQAAPGKAGGAGATGAAPDKKPWWRFW